VSEDNRDAPFISSQQTAEAFYLSPEWRGLTALDEHVATFAEPDGLIVAV